MAKCIENRLDRQLAEFSVLDTSRPARESTGTLCEEHVPPTD